MNEDADDLNVGLYTFLQNRGVNTDFLKKEKIDIAVIEVMEDGDLAKFIPLYGDRIALRTYIKKLHEKRKQKNKVTLVASLRKKLKNMRRPKKCNNTEMFEKDESDSDPQSSESATNPYKGNQNAKKETRKIKFGIKSKVGDSFFNIRVKRGGGPRDISVQKSLKKKELIESAKQLYFGTSGISKLGSVDNFSFDMQNFEEETLQDEISVGKLYEQTGLSKLTYYLLLIPKTEEMPKIQRPQKRPRTTGSSYTCTSDYEEELPDPSAPIFYHSDILSEALKAADVTLYSEIDKINPVNIDSSSGMSTVSPSEFGTFTSSSIHSGPFLCFNTDLKSDTITITPSNISTDTDPASVINTGPPSVISTDPPSGVNIGPPSGISTDPPSVINTGPPSGISTGPPSVINTGPPSVISTDPPSVINTGPPSGISTDPPSVINTGPPSGISTDPPSVINTGPPSVISTDPPSVINTGPPSGISTDPPSVINTGPPSGISTDPPSVINTSPPEGINTDPPSNNNIVFHEEFVSLLPCISYTGIPATETDRVLRVHRVTLLDEMIVCFKDPEILDKNVSFEFVNEHGSDMNGVSRDAYSAFWSEFFRRSSEGEESRVPALNSKWQAEEWQAIGRIFAKGFKDQNIFPLQMSPVTTIVVSFGEASITTKVLNDAFLNYVSQVERHTLISALEKESFDEELLDELLDLLDRFACTQRPTKENLQSLINNIAHKELIQKPKYATDNMAIGCRDVLLTHFISVEKILITYQDFEPTPKKVLKIIEATPNGNNEALSLRYFRQYIRGQNSTSLKKLLRFLTGSEAVTVDKIDVSFTKVEGFGRRPVAHTCGPHLELPCTYLSYPELRNEFDSILADESCFVMNMA